MPKSIEQLRRDAKALRRAYEALDPDARTRMQIILPNSAETPFKHADFLHVIACENNFDSWPKLVCAAKTIGLDRAAKQQRLKTAIFHGQNWVIEQLLADTPDLPDGQFELEVSLYRRAAVEAALSDAPELATSPFGPRRPILHLAFSKWIHARPDLESDMLAIVEMLVGHGAVVNDGFPFTPGDDHLLSTLYGAIGHTDNIVLGRWLLENGANPNDGESLYHATELGHHDGLKLLLEFGADPAGTNALLRAMDFDDLGAVRLLLDAGARADEWSDELIGGEKPGVIPALHQGARRMCSRPIVDALLDAGADPTREFEGLTPYAYARIFGNAVLAEALEERGHATRLSEQEELLAQLADGDAQVGVFLDPDKLPPAVRNITRLILHLPGKLPHIKRLVSAGAEYDRPDDQGLTPVQLAGWEGLPEMLEYFLSLKPDLSHVSGYGGTLLSTIIHGSENAPDRASRDHIACLELALMNGVALPKRAVQLAGEPHVAAFLADWADAHPGQVVEVGVG